MEEAKKQRTNKARVVTRRTTEVKNAVASRSLPEDVTEKIKLLKTSMNELGPLHDNVIELIAADENYDANISKEEEWYYKYDTQVNNAVRDGKVYAGDRTHQGFATSGKSGDPVAKLKKLEIPSFYADHREYFKWKEMFERYTKHLDDLTRYDYLYNYTKGEAKVLISNKQSYREAISSMDREYGNKNYTMKLLIDDIRILSVIRKGEHNIKHLRVYRVKLTDLKID